MRPRQWEPDSSHVLKSYGATEVPPPYSGSSRYTAPQPYRQPARCAADLCLQYRRKFARIKRNHKTILIRDNALLQPVRVLAVVFLGYAVEIPENDFFIRHVIGPAVAGRRGDVIGRVRIATGWRSGLDQMRRAR